MLETFSPSTRAELTRPPLVFLGFSPLCCGGGRPKGTVDEPCWSARLFLSSRDREMAHYFLFFCVCGLFLRPERWFVRIAFNWFFFLLTRLLSVRSAQLINRPKLWGNIGPDPYRKANNGPL